MTSHRRRVLFVSWDGGDQSYLLSLYLPLLEALRPYGFEPHVLQMRWGSRELLQATQEEARRRGIGYQPHSVVRLGGAMGSAATLAAAGPKLAREARRLGQPILLPRSLLPAAMVLAARPRLRPSPILFDADGLMADERLESSGWRPRGLPYRSLRRVEARMIRRADAVTTRSAGAREILLDRVRATEREVSIHVVPNGSDSEVFRPRSAGERATARRSHAIPREAPWMVYCGSLGPQYRPPLILEAFRLLRSSFPDARLTVLTGQLALGETLLREAGLRREEATVIRAGPREVAAILGSADIALAPRQRSFSQRAVSPIKVGEYLLSGLPIIYSEGIGDLDPILGAEPRAAHPFPDSAEKEEALRRWLRVVLADRRESDASRRAIRGLGLRYFSLAAMAEGMAAALEDAVSRFARAQR